MASILFIPAPLVERGKVLAHIPYGLLSLQAVAEQCGHDTRILDLSALKSVVLRTSDELAGAIADCVGESEKQVVGLSTMCSSFHHSLGVAVELRHRYPDIDIWIGGPQASVYPDALLGSFPEIEAVFVGESEETFREVLVRANGKPSTSGMNLPGVCARGTPFVPRPPIEDLDTLPPIAFARDYLASYVASEDPSSAGASLEAQRGCPGRCTFCSTRLFWGNRVRYKSDMRVIEEMRGVHALTGSRLFYLLGDNLAASRQRLLAFSRIMAQEAPDLLWEGCVTIDGLQGDDLEVLWAGGCRKLFVGLESGSQNTLDRSRKGIDLQRSIRLIARALETGISIHVSLIVGFPWETAYDVGQTFGVHAELLKMGAYSHMSTVCPLPGTDLTEDEVFEMGTGDSAAAFDGLPYGPGAERIIARCPQLFTQLGRFVTQRMDRSSLRMNVRAASMMTSYYGRLSGATRPILS